MIEDESDPQRAAADDPEDEDAEEAFYEGIDDGDDLLADHARKRVRKRARKAEQNRGGLSTRMKVALVCAMLVGMGAAFALGGSKATLPADHPDIHAMMSGAQAPSVSVEEWATAMASLEDALEANPDDIEAHLEIGMLLFDMGNTETAMEHWNRVVELAPNDARGWYYMGFGRLAAHPSDPEGAKAAWEQAISIDPQSDIAATLDEHLRILGAAQSSPMSGE